MSKMMFSSEVELGKFLGSVDIIPEAYGAISETNLIYELHTASSGINVLAFNYSSDHTTRFPKAELDLIPSENLHVLNFVSTKVNPKFSVNKTAIELFQDLGDDLKELENKHINTPLIITGSGLGGYLAILSTLRLHHAIDVEESNGSKKTKRPICITFGSPLVGDTDLYKAIAERPKWKSSFLNVVAKNDPLASFFSSNSEYKPFGTFLFCIESGGLAAFEDQESILLVLDAMKSSGSLQVYDYTNILSSIRKKVLYRGVSEPGEFNLNPLRVGITLQLKEIGVLDDISNVRIGEMEKKQRDMIRKKNMVNAYDPTKKLNETKISLTYMEWYMKTRREEGGYYDSYKNAKGKDEMEKKNLMVKHQRILNQYWKNLVDEKDIVPQKEGAKLRNRWLLSGNNYRRMVEPLDIAEYYEKGNTNYINHRPNYYILLEKWFIEYKEELESNKEKKDSDSGDEKRTQAVSLTEDSCFWAHVEEALILLQDLVNRKLDHVEKEEKLKQFEAYLMDEIKKYSVSPDVFIKGSSLMKWWNEYKAHKGNAYASEFADYMNSGSYKLYH